jgi:glycerophosphoryl diester phosphodiesterase
MGTMKNTVTAANCVLHLRHFRHPWRSAALLLTGGLLASSTTALAQSGRYDDDGARGAYGEHAPYGDRGKHFEQSVELGPRPAFLVNEMRDGRLKRELAACLNDEPHHTDFSIGHRGAALQFPEHTKESYEAGFRMGAGILECDVTFTKDLQLVCRHAQNDLATTTNILLTPLASTCIQPFTPAVLDSAGGVVTPARAECRTSEITLAEFKTLRGKMDAFNPAARTPEQFVGGTANFRTDLYSGPTSGTLLTHAESIALFQRLGAKMTPELKSASVTMPFNGFTQEQYAQKMIDEYKAARVNPRHVFPQSFDIRDVRYWIKSEPHFGRQAVYLDDAQTVAELPSYAELAAYKAEGINIWAPPTFALLALDASKRIVASEHADYARAAGLDMITWTLERSGLLTDQVPNGFYYQTIDAAITREGDLMEVIDVLARDVGVLGVFSDWAAPVSFYASCTGLN